MSRTTAVITEWWMPLHQNTAHLYEHNVTDREVFGSVYLTHGTVHLPILNATTSAGNSWSEDMAVQLNVLVGDTSENVIDSLTSIYRLQVSADIYLLGSGTFRLLSLALLFVVIGRRRRRHLSFLPVSPLLLCLLVLRFALGAGAAGGR